MTALTFDHPVTGRLARPTAAEAPWARLGPARPGERRRRLRRRLATVLVLMGIAFTAGIVLAVTVLSSPAGGSLTEEARRARQVTYVVRPGDTLWQAAARLAPESDPREVVDALIGARGTSQIRPGETLVWPVS